MTPLKAALLSHAVGYLAGPGVAPPASLAECPRNSYVVANTLAARIWAEMIEAGLAELADTDKPLEFRATPRGFEALAVFFGHREPPPTDVLVEGWCEPYSRVVFNATRPDAVLLIVINEAPTSRGNSFSVLQRCGYDLDVARFLHAVGEAIEETRAADEAAVRVWPRKTGSRRRRKR